MPRWIHVARQIAPGGAKPRSGARRLGLGHRVLGEAACTARGLAQQQLPDHLDEVAGLISAPPPGSLMEHPKEPCFVQLRHV